MKKIILYICIGLITLPLAGFAAIYVLIDLEVQKNIRVAKEKYSGTAEEALIAYLLDTTNSATDRSNIAIWTLGQIKSEKAVPVLKGLSKNDPAGKTCRGRHDSIICQYELFKALEPEKSNWWPLHKRLNK